MLSKIQAKTQQSALTIELVDLSLLLLELLYNKLLCFDFSFLHLPSKPAMNDFLGGSGRRERRSNSVGKHEWMPAPFYCTNDLVYYGVEVVVVIVVVTVVDIYFLVERTQQSLFTGDQL